MRANVQGVVSHCDIYAFGCVIIVLFQQRQLWPGLNGPVENFYEESLTVAEYELFLYIWRHGQDSQCALS